MSEGFTFLALMATVASGTALLAVPDVHKVDTPTEETESAAILAPGARFHGSSQGIFVDAEINGKRLTFLVDTGASLTILSDTDARALGIEGKERKLITGIGGTVEAKLAQIDLNVQGQEISNMPVAVLDGAPQSLLGLDAMHRLGKPKLIFD